MSSPVGSLTTPIAITSPPTTRAFLHFRLLRETISTGLQIMRCIPAIDFGGEIWFFTLVASFGDCSDGTLRQVWPCNEVLSYRKAMVWTTHLTMSSPVCSLTTPIAISSPSTTHASLHFRLFGETISTSLQILRCIAQRFDRYSALRYILEPHTKKDFVPKTFPRCC